MKSMLDIMQVSQEDAGADMLLYQEHIDIEQNDIEMNVINTDIEKLRVLGSAYEDTVRIGTVIETKIQSGEGISPLTAKLASIAVESIYSRLELNIPDHLLPSLESFSNPKTRVSATRISLENISDHVNRIVKAIYDTMLKIWKRVKEFMKKLSNQSDRIIEDLKKTLKEVEALPDSANHVSGHLGDRVATENFDTETPYMRRIPFGIKGRCDFHTVQTIIKDTESLMYSNRGVIDQIGRCLPVIAASGRVADQAVKAGIEKIISAIKHGAEKLERHNKKNNGHIEITTYGNLFHNQVYEIQDFIAKGHEDDEVKLFHIHVSFKTIKPIAFKPDLLQREQMANLGKSAIATAAKAKDFENASAALSESLEENIIRAQNKDHNSSYDFAIEDSGFADIHGQARIENAKLMHELFSFVTKVMPKLSTDANRISVSIGYYIKDCVAEYRMKSF